MTVLQFFGVALGLFMRHLLYTGVSGGPCTVVISANPFITEMVTSPSEIKVGCFKYADNLEEAVFYSTNKINLDSTNEAVKKCAKLARDKGFELFALGKNGLCLSGADMKHKYHIGGTNRARCRDGIGIGNSMFVYSLEPAPSLQPLGCYVDKRSNRALPVLYANFRGQGVNWNKMELTVNRCARVAHDKGYGYFAVQFYAVCYGGKDGEKNYAKHGNTSDCWVFDNKTGFGVGKHLANFVYKIKL